MNSTRVILAAMVLGTALGSSQASAQGCIGVGECSATNTASVSVGALVKLGMSSATTTLSAPDADDIAAGATLQDIGPTLSIRANRSWTLKIKSGNAANWTYVGSNSGLKPIGDLAWATTAGGTYTPITANDVTFASGAGATNGDGASSFFRTTWSNDFSSASNAEGTYSLPIVFTLSAP